MIQIRRQAFSNPCPCNCLRLPRPPTLHLPAPSLGSATWQCHLRDSPRSHVQGFVAPLGGCLQHASWHGGRDKHRLTLRAFCVRVGSIGTPAYMCQGWKGERVGGVQGWRIGGLVGESMMDKMGYCEATAVRLCYSCSGGVKLPNYQYV